MKNTIIKSQQVKKCCSTLVVTGLMALTSSVSHAYNITHFVPPLIMATTAKQSDITSFLPEDAQAIAEANGDLIAELYYWTELDPNEICASPNAAAHLYEDLLGVEATAKKVFTLGRGWDIQLGIGLNHEYGCAIGMEGLQVTQTREYDTWGFSVGVAAGGEAPMTIGYFPNMEVSDIAGSAYGIATSVGIGGVTVWFAYGDPEAE